MKTRFSFFGSILLAMLPVAALFGQAQTNVELQQAYPTGRIAPQTLEQIRSNLQHDQKITFSDDLSTILIVGANSAADQEVQEEEVIPIEDPLQTSASATAAIRIFPNPSKGRFQLHSSLPFYRWEVYTSDGKLIATQTGAPRSDDSILLEGLTSGTYFLRLYRIEGAPLVHPLMIQSGMEPLRN
jgi:hypothetical protein